MKTRLETAPKPMAIPAALGLGAFVPSNVFSATHARQNPRHGTLEGSGEMVFPLE